MVEMWLASVHVPGAAGAYGQAAEAEGFDGISFGDTQHLAADPFVGLGLVAGQTDRLGLMIGVTNPVTRVPAVTAAAIATVQAASAGRPATGIRRPHDPVHRAGPGLPPR
jgi:5,10-methylenetetrahydromethanopterin reductase